MTLGENFSILIKFNPLTPFDYLEAKKKFGGQNGAEITSSQTYNSNTS
jgi:hypothetical protein